MDVKIKRHDNPMSPPVFYILLALADQERHGYAVMQDVEQRTRGTMRLLPGSLYSTLKRMVKADLIEECDAPVGVLSDDERRRYYRITTAGREAAGEEVERMTTLLQLADEKRLVPEHLLEDRGQGA